MDGHDEGQMGGCFVVEAKGQSSKCVVPCRSCLPFCLGDPGKTCQLNRIVIYLMRKSAAWTAKGATIHWAVSSAQAMWPSSNKNRKVIKSVRTSAKPRITLKNVNLMIENIAGLEKGFKSIVKEFVILYFFSCPDSYVPTLSQSLSDCHFRIWTQRVTSETWDPSDI